MHKILEHLDFTSDDPAQMHDLVMEKLETFGYDPIWKQPICDMFKRVFSSQLDPNCPGLTLSCIPAEERLNELEFYYPLKKITPATLKNLFHSMAATPKFQDFPTHIERLNFNPAVGFMKGFIDLVFLFKGRYYLVDWKSNFLGTKKEDYNQQALMKTMIEEYYILQYHIYCIALNQYLSLRIPDYRYETHFGGVFYLFLRGISQNQGDEFGIFRDRPDEKFIRMLCQSFLDMSEMVIS
jgi:exodeoxyribonuclease V beta subunit